MLQAAQLLADVHYIFSNCQSLSSTLRPQGSYNFRRQNADMICTLGGYERFCLPNPLRLKHNPYGSTCPSSGNMEEKSFELFLQPTCRSIFRDLMS